MKSKSLAAVLSSAAISAAAQAGVFTQQSLTASPAAAADASSEISLSKIYTHAVDWNSDDGGAVVNGVTLGAGGTTGTNYTLIGTNNFFQSNPSNNYDPASGMFDLNDDFLFTGPGSPFQTLTLTGLTGGTSYIISHYLSSGWNGAEQILDGDDDGFGFNTLTTDRGDAAGPKVIRYSYTQAAGDTDFQMTFDAVNDADGFHHYAFTNEVVPEPSALGLLVLAGCGLFGRRIRRT